jgi:hypothetical protein
LTFLRRTRRDGGRNVKSATLVVYQAASRMKPPEHDPEKWTLVFG